MNALMSHTEAAIPDSTPTPVPQPASNTASGKIGAGDAITTNPTATNPTSALSRPTVRSLLNLGTGHLRVSLFEGVSVLIPMIYVQEVIALPAHRLSALPNMPAPVLGLMNRRSQVVWLADLSYVLGLGRLDLAPQTHHVVVLKVGKLSVGFAISAIEGMVAVPPECQIPVPSQVPPSALPYLQMCARLGLDHEQNSELLMVINPEALLQSPVLQPMT
jgi:positive phototaxis protein PixI